MEIHSIFKNFLAQNVPGLTILKMKKKETRLLDIP